MCRKVIKFEPGISEQRNEAHGKVKVIIIISMCIRYQGFFLNIAANYYFSKARHYEIDIIDNINFFT